MSCRGLYVFAHDSQYGNAPSHLLFDKINIKIEAYNYSPRFQKDY
ncbi:hypothetical protein ACE38V_08370 [Cytobacillus sp. Hz8]